MRILLSAKFKILRVTRQKKFLKQKLLGGGVVGGGGEGGSDRKTLENLRISNSFHLNIPFGNFPRSNTFETPSDLKISRG